MTTKESRPITKDEMRDLIQKMLTQFSLGEYRELADDLGEVEAYDAAIEEARRIPA